MRGYLVMKNKRYYAVVYEGTDPLTRRERRTWRAAGTSRREAERFLAELVQARNGRGPVFPGRMSLESYIVDHWLPTRRSNLRPSTLARYEREAFRHINPFIGHIPLHRVTAADLDALYTALLERGRRDGNGLAPKTVLNIHQILRAALRDAFNRGSSPATRLCSPIHRSCGIASATNRTRGRHGSSRLSSNRVEIIASGPRSTSRRRPACGAVRCSDFAGAISILSHATRQLGDLVGEAIRETEPPEEVLGPGAAVELGQAVEAGDPGEQVDRAACRGRARAPGACSPTSAGPPPTPAHRATRRSLHRGRARRRGSA